MCVCVCACSHSLQHERNLFIVSKVLRIVSCHLKKKIVKRAAIFQYVSILKRYFFVWGFYNYIDKRHMLNKSTNPTCKGTSDLKNKAVHLLQQVTRKFPFSLIKT